MMREGTLSGCQKFNYSLYTIKEKLLEISILEILMPTRSVYKEKRLFSNIYHHLNGKATSSPSKQFYREVAHLRRRRSDWPKQWNLWLLTASDGPSQYFGCHRFQNGAPEVDFAAITVLVKYLLTESTM